LVSFEDELQDRFCRGVSRQGEFEKIGTRQCEVSRVVVDVDLTQAQRFKTGLGTNNLLESQTVHNRMKLLSIQIEEGQALQGWCMYTIT
jgi:hypothetical protein